MNATALKLTPLEHKALSLIHTLSFFDMGIEGGSDSWFNIVTQELTPAVGETERSTAGVLRSLVKKGMFTTGPLDPQSNGVPADRPIALTDLGAETIMDIRNGKLESPAKLRVVATSGDQPIQVDVEEGTPEDEVLDAIAEINDKPIKLKKPKTNKKPKAPVKATPAPTGTRTSHADCGHASTKAARAICRRERAKATKK